MGKWASFKNKLKALPLDVEYQEKVDHAKRGFKRKGIRDLTLAFGRTYRAKKSLEEKIKLMNVELAALDQLIMSWMEDNGQTQFRLRSGALISIKDDVYAHVQDQKKFFKWIKQSRSVYLLSVHPKKLESLVKDRLENGQGSIAEPVPGVRAFLKSSISYRGKYKKESNDEKQDNNS